MKKIFIFCFAALMFAACSNESVPADLKEVKTGFPYTITASFAENNEDPAVRANLTNPTPDNPATATWSVAWKVGDEIRVFNQPGQDNTVVYVVKSISGGVATFELKEGEDIGKFTESTTFFAAMGGSAKDENASSTIGHSYLSDINSDNEGGIEVGLVSFKSILEGTIDNAFFTAVAKATLTDGTLNFQFLPVVSYIRVTVPEGMTYDVGKLYCQSTLSGGKTNPSGFYRIRMNADGNTIKVVGQRYQGGSANAPFWYGTGTSEVKTKPFPTFPAGVYYMPVIPACTIKKLVVYDTQNTAKCTRTFDSPGFAAGRIYDFGTIPTNPD